MLTLIFLVFFTSSASAMDFEKAQAMPDTTLPHNFIAVHPSPGVTYLWRPGSSKSITDLGSGVNGFTSRNSSGIAGQGLIYSAPTRPDLILPPQHKDGGQSLLRQFRR